MISFGREKHPPNACNRWRHEDPVPLVLTHVVVHEITPVLEGIPRHSHMRRSPLPLAAKDIRLIQAS
jgi:hypothetical protein